MMDAKYIAEQASSIHHDNRVKGFWENPRPVKIVLGLVCSEMMEAFEGIRKNKRSSVVDAATLLTFINPRTGVLLIPAAQYAEYYENMIKDTAEAELAGTAIRCFDTMGGRIYEGGGFISDGTQKDEQLNISQLGLLVADKIAESLKGAERMQMVSADDEAEFFAELLVDMMPCALGIQTGGPQWQEFGIANATTELASVADTLKNMCLLSVWFGIDLKTHILLEVTYNRTRPRKHGNNRF